MPAQKRPRPASPSSLCQNLDSEQNDEFASINLSKIRKEVQCPICLGILWKTQTVVECLHRFCKECIEKSMRHGNHECPLCRVHCPSRRSLRDDPNFDSLIAAIYPDIDKSEKEIQNSTAQTSRQQLEALGRKRLEKATASASARIAPGTQPSFSESIEKLLQVYPATSCLPAVPKSLNEACSSLCQAMSKVVEAAGSEGEKARKKVEELQLQISTKDAELTRYKLLAEAHKKKVDALTEELKMSTDQVDTLDKKIAEHETVEEERASRLHRLEQLQSENPQLVKECVRRLFRTRGFGSFIKKLLEAAWLYGLFETREVRSMGKDFKETGEYDPKAFFVGLANALTYNDLDFPLLHEIDSLAEPLTLSSLERWAVEENLELQKFIKR